METKTDRYVRRYFHAAARFRQRYGPTLSLEEYARICDVLAAGGGTGRRSNEGRIEAWVESCGVNAYAVFDRDEELVVSFLPVPPESQPKLAAQYREIKRENAQLRTEVNNLRQKLARPKAKSPKPAPSTQLGWFKDQIRIATGMLVRGETEPALRLLDALVSLPKDIDPINYPEAVEQMVQEMIGRQRAYYAEKNGGAA